MYRNTVMIKVIFFDLYQTLLDVELNTSNQNREVQSWGIFAKSLYKHGPAVWVKNPNSPSDDLVDQESHNSIDLKNIQNLPNIIKKI